MPNTYSGGSGGKGRHLKADGQRMPEDTLINLAVTGKVYEKRRLYL